MAKVQKKGKQGAAVTYITRQQALKKLQISLADFRRLCILKGIYPRVPKNHKKANKGSSAPATFYYAKDIRYLLHEPLLQKFREYKIFARKLNKVLRRNEMSKAKSLQDNCKPIYTLDHIVKERYPTFIDALRDLDDALSMLYLFARLPAENSIKANMVADCQRLIAEFQTYVANTRSLRKVFFSIKGIYYQAEIKGQTITWIVPYQFSQDIPDDVDFRVMLTFLEFYITLMGFVNFRLYSEMNASYPPKFEKTANYLEVHSISFGGNNAEVMDDQAAVDSLDEFKSTAQDEEEQDANAITLQKIQQQTNEISALRNLFSKCVFFISRETPRYALEFMIRSCGGQVSWDETAGANPPYPETDERITHQICDRPSVPNRILSRHYVQPQWVADCINARKLLQTKYYEPGQVLPPHLSPFVEAKEGDYVPESAESFIERAERGEQEDDEQEELEEDGEEEETLEEKDEVKVVKEEEDEEEQAETPKKPTKTKKRTAAEIEEQEQKEMAHIMMSNKQRKLYKQMQYGLNKKKEEVAKLERKKKALKKKAAKN